MGQGDIGLGAIVSLRDRFSANAGKVGISAQRLDTTMGASAGRISKNVKRVGIGLGLLAVGAITLKATLAPVSAAADFEKSMNRVRALSGATRTEFAMLSAQARELGATTVFSATQAAEGQAALALAGFKTVETLGAMPAVLTLAAAGQLDLGQSADITAKIMRGFGLQAQDTTRIADVLAKAFTTANTDLGELGQAFKFAGPVAKAVGFQFEETASALQAMADAGFSGTMGGTALRKTMSTLAQQTEKPTGKLRKLGIVIKDATTGAMLPFANIIDQISAKGLSAGKIMELFGERAGPGLLSLLERGGDALRRMTKTLENSGGTAQRIADVQMAGLRGSIVLLTSAWEGFNIAVGTPLLLPAMTAITTSIGKALQAATAFAELNPELVTIASTFFAVAGSVLFIAGTMLALRGIAGLTGILMTKTFLRMASASALASKRFRFLAISTSISFSIIKRAALGFVTTFLPLAGFIALFGVMVSAVRGGRDSFGSSIGKMLSNGRLVFKALGELFSTFTGTTGKLSAETTKELQRAGLLPFVARMFAVFARARALVKGFADGVGGAISEMGAVVRKFLPDGTSLINMFRDVTNTAGPQQAGGAIRSTIQDFTTIGSVIGFAAVSLAIFSLVMKAFKAITLATSLVFKPFILLWELYATGASLAGKGNITFLGTMLPLLLPLALIAAAIAWVVVRWEALTAAFAERGFIGILGTILGDVIGLIVSLGEAINVSSKFFGFGNIVDKTGLKELKRFQGEVFKGSGLTAEGQPVPGGPAAAAAPRSPASLIPPQLLAPQRAAAAAGGGFGAAELNQISELITGVSVTGEVRVPLNIDGTQFGDAIIELNRKRDQLGPEQ